jgi:hypothetical protein
VAVSGCNAANTLAPVWKHWRMLNQLAAIAPKVPSEQTSWGAGVEQKV